MPGLMRRESWTLAPSERIDLQPEWFLRYGTTQVAELLAIERRALHSGPWVLPGASIFCR